jgi:lipopolysaccharide transport system ATP-binding protein
MSNIALRVENLGKRYRIGQRQQANGRLSERLMELIRAPFGRRRPAAKEPGADEIWALRHASFEIEVGKVVGIIGRNGAGKSTLLKLLSRISEPSEGRAEIYGRLGSLLEVGTGFHPELTGRENIFLSGAILGMTRREIYRKLDEIIAFAEIDRFLDTPVKRYSSGMYVKLAFAVAAHLQPEILLVDEILAVGDSAFQKKCLGKMGEIGKQGRTVVLISHNMASIVNLCQRAILLNGGTTLADGAPADVVKKYFDMNQSFSGQRVWENLHQAPGTNVVRLHRVAIFQEESPGPVADVDISRDVLVKISYWNMQEGAHLYSAMCLKDRIGTVVFASANLRSISLTEDPGYGSPRPVGLYEAVCRIPGNTLNEGSYCVTAIVGKGTQETQIREEDAVCFDVVDTGEMRKEYLGTWIGLVRPKLAWHTRLLASGFPERLAG